MTNAERDRWLQPLPTPAEALEVYREGQRSRPGAGNPYAGRRVLGGIWATGNREAFRREYDAWQLREAERRRQAHVEAEAGDD
ncbi:ribosome modulation factor [Gordonia westfalica]|uniref:Uncharacterized protein n=1 Tax=Gordonia westfalica TaxID=158898 RepID=A0A1H2KPH9_9ACTN|nr:hypothetical protein [Gordonia westfalica]SDU70563.1 hypothetical protein SAMN04488548_1343511 [Gordonia westfalica]